MLVVTLPDGSTREFNAPLTVAAVAMSIGPALGKAALAGEIDGRLVDISHTIQQNVALRIITERDAEGLAIIRHSAAHLLAHAVQSLFKGVQVTIGPVIQDGFYYDFAFSRPFTMEDLVAIEAKMADLVKADLAIVRKKLSRAEAIALFHQKSETYKVQIIEAIPNDEALSFYQQGDFIDLCRGPHVPSTGRIKAFKLIKVAGAYWRGDSRNEMLQRIYGTAWSNKKDLEAYLYRIEEAERRDHRKLAKKLDLFHFQEEAPGMVFWHANGWAIYQVIEAHIRQILNSRGYQEVRTPQIVDRTLWEQSGHWSKFHDSMFVLQADQRDYAIKPMNCPCHIQIFNQGLKSYRDLPLRLSEFGSCHRYELSGALHGLMRVRNFVQDDGHIFCTEAQIQEEVAAFNSLLFEVYQDFGFNELTIKLSTRPPERVGDDAVWDKAEQALEIALQQAGLKWEWAPGEGAFYGPKIEYSCQDSLGRVWQCGTIQVDFSMPERLGAYYITEEGLKRAPVMLHRAILGSLERFMGILLEESNGSLPVWLAPIQGVVLNITDAQANFVQTVVSDLQKKGFRVQGDLRNEKIGFKIREHTLKRVPYLLVVGEREVEHRSISVRTREGVDLGAMGISEFSNFLASAVAHRARRGAAGVHQEQNHVN